MIISKKIKLIVGLIISVALTSCSANSYEVDMNDKEKTFVTEDTNQKEKNKDVKSYSVVIDSVQNKATKIVGTVVFDESFDGICEVTGSDSEYVNISIDEDKEIISITSKKKYLNTSGNLVIKLGVIVESININKGNFNLDLIVDSIEEFNGVFECAVNGEIKSNKVKNFKLEILGAGKVILTGNADSSSILVAGASVVLGEEMKVNNVKVKLQGVGSCNVYASNSLNAYVEGIGSIIYDGNPGSVTKKVDGLGVIKKGN